MRRHSLGVKIDILFSDILECISEAQFSLKNLRGPLISRAITKNDLLKFELYALFELKGIPEDHFLEISNRLEEIGRILYGWLQNTLKENRSPLATGEKKTS